MCHGEAGNFRGRKPLRISRTREDSQNFYSRKVKRIEASLCVIQYIDAIEDAM